MNDIFNEQKEILVSIKKEISLLHQQVDYLIRNEQPLGLLDLDVMMNRTHTLYDKLCSINLGKEMDEELPAEARIHGWWIRILKEEKPQPSSRCRIHPRDGYRR